MLVGLYLTYIIAVTQWRPRLAPPLTDAANAPLDAWREAAVAAGAPLLLILAILASIFFGIATPTEGGAVGVCAALLIGLTKHRLSRQRLAEALTNTGVLCSSVIFLLLGASFFMLVFRGFNGQVWIEQLFGQLPQGQLPFLLFMCIGIFLLGFFLDFFEIAFIVVPLIAPVARKLGIDMVWFTVIVAVVLQTSFMHPPFGIALYNLRSVAPSEVRTSDIYLGAIPFLVLQMAMVGILVAFPGIASTPPPAATLTDKQVEDALRMPSDPIPEPSVDTISNK
jgi:tripartite ATP-independent transporter DctM subunit